MTEEQDDGRRDGEARRLQGYVLLADLGRGHELRTTPLGALGAECRNKLSTVWREVSRWRIGTATYDQLGTAWTDTSEFRVPVRTKCGGEEKDGAPERR